ncbi:DUF4124 domain-containing protein [Ramlibacter sp. AN1133]|uniref:DUF4124 domain-containing protein n=1 Tax=Ramlibacter sp. AN1133 TaxID=3133429 RepID=UPI0030C27E19
MKGIALALLAAGAAFCAPANAINKCTGPEGKVTFQDAPCAAGKAETIDVHPSSGVAPRTPSAPAAAGSAPRSEAARLEGIIAASQRSRRSQDLRERVLPDAERTLQQHRHSCEAKQKDLQSQQYAYTQNLYGKTHAAQIASEMAAAAALCDTKDRELKEAVDTLTKECATLRCRG